MTNAPYLNALCKEKIWIQEGGPEFGSEEGLMIIIKKKALYGLNLLDFLGGQQG